MDVTEGSLKGLDASPAVAETDVACPFSATFHQVNIVQAIPNVESTGGEHRADPRVVTT